MKKTVKFLSGMAVVAAIAFVGFSSFTPPDEDCGCPEGWNRLNYLIWEANHPLFEHPNKHRDKNMDGFICAKNIPNSEGKKIGNNLGWYANGRNWIDNNKCSKGKNKD